MELSKSDFKQFIADHPAVIMYFTAKWCKPCNKIMTPVFDVKKEKYGNKVNFIKVDVDKSEELCEYLKIRSMPTIIVFVDGKEADKSQSADIDKFKGMYHKLLRTFQK